MFIKNQFFVFFRFNKLTSCKSDSAIAYNYFSKTLFGCMKSLRVSVLGSSKMLVFRSSWWAEGDFAATDKRKRTIMG